MRFPKKDYDWESVRQLEQANVQVIAKGKKAKALLERPNWSLMLVGVGPHPTQACQKIVRRFEELGHRLVHASLVLDSNKSERLEFCKAAVQAAGQTGGTD